MRVPALVLTALILASCGRPAEAPAAPEVAADAAAKLSQNASEPAAASRGGAPAPAPIAPPSAPMLAYSYDYRIAAAPKAVRALVARHEAACVAAGAALCQVTASNVAAVGEGDVRGSLTLRAEPGWLRKFRDGLAREAHDAGGEVVSAGATSEDLTRQIVDTEAALRAKTTLRDRLQSLLATRPGKLSELLELEQALSGVQQQIDATQSELAVMRPRVATSALQITYESTGIAGAPGAWTPLTRALGDTGAMLAGSLGALVRIVVTAAPWALVIGALLWLLRKSLPRRKPKSPKADPPPAV